MTCKAPTCAARVSKRTGVTSCACPNPWTEFLSRQAASRRRKRQPRFSWGQHGQAYRRARAAGVFVRPGGRLGERCGRCKTDAVKLCTWHVVRTRGLRDPQGAFARAHRSRGRRAVGGFVDGALRVSSSRGLDGLRERMGLHKLNPPLRVLRKLGEGIGGAVYLARQEGGGGELRAVKLMTGRLDLLPKEVYMQKAFARWMLAPKVHAAYVYRQRGVVVMDPIETTMHEVLKDARTKPRRTGVMRFLGHELKRMVKLMQDHRLCHGDLHMHNLGYQMRRGKPRLVFIDFGRSFRYPSTATGADEAHQADVFWVWRSAQVGRYSSELHRALTAVNFPGSVAMQNIFGTGRPELAEHQLGVVDMIAQDVLHRQDELEMQAGTIYPDVPLLR